MVKIIRKSPYNIAASINEVDCLNFTSFKNVQLQTVDLLLLKTVTRMHNQEKRRTTSIAAEKHFLF